MNLFELLTTSPMMIIAATILLGVIIAAGSKIIHRP